MPLIGQFGLIASAFVSVLRLCRFFYNLRACKQRERNVELAYQNVMYLPGVGPKRAELLKTEMKIYSAEDLLHFYPYKHIDRTRFYRIREISDDQTYVQIKGQIMSFSKQGEGRNARLTAIFSDGEQTIELVWFKGAKFIQDKLKTGVIYVLFGKPSVFNHEYNFVHPELETLAEYTKGQTLGLEPYYNTTEKMKAAFLNSKAIRKIMYGLMPQVAAGLPETLPASLLQRFGLMNLTQTMQQIHFPKNIESLKRARQRLKFEELFYIQLQILRQTKWREQNIKGYSMPVVGEHFNRFYKEYLPFPLTNAQKRVIKEIRLDMMAGKQMNRLLQGDVGSGKTLVALMCALIATDNHFQTCIMAPTEILANQHFQSLSAMLGDMDVRIDLLTGSTPAKKRATLHEDLRSGKLDILIGTHALLEDVVVFHNLGLVIIDEQHRFGVAQRAKLWGKNNRPPHVLVMTATPIPRTLAMTIYGDLNVSVIDELPPGRKPIETYHYFNTKRQTVNTFLYKQIMAGRQAYIVYPLIQESEKSDLANLEAGCEYMRETFPQFKISMVHGKLKPAEKELQMQRFATGQTQIMVATTVIEVGVNVPNATIMVIENAERFGLSQLHQLRGRVGRGAEQSFCILLTGVKLSSDTRQRMDIMVRTNNGFEISEADLKLRGPGDLEGTAQSGLPFELKVANLATDGRMLEIARRTAIEILDDDPNLEKPENEIFVRQLEKLNKQAVNWGVIS